MRLPDRPQLPTGAVDGYARELDKALLKHLRDSNRKVNQMAAGTLAGFDGTATTQPTTGTWAQGDQLKNPAPTELGAPGAKYVLLGFVCVTGGSPGSWRQIRTLTGN